MSAVTRSSPPDSVTASGSTAVTVCPRWNRTPCSSWTPFSRPPSSGPSVRSNGTTSGATTWTSSPRARSDAATSMPMKLAPTTTARRARVARSMIARLSVSVRNVSTCGWSPPGSAGRTGSAPVASSSASQSTSRPSARVSLCFAGSMATTRALSASAIFCSPKNAGGRSGIHSSGALPAR